MEFRFTAEQEQFRQEIRGFLGQELPAQWEGAEYEGGSDDAWEFARGFTRKLAMKGWVCPHWPKEYGGAGMTVMEQLIYNEELAYHRAPRINSDGVSMLGPVLIIYGTEEQKQEHLPGIANAEVIWCQGYSEPGSGSDLASLQTRAVREGDDFVINGQKIWTSEAWRGDWMFLLARTDPDAPKHRGISFFMMDKKSPGVTVSPLINLANQHGFNQVFFDNVRIPAKNLVGELNRGWYIGATLLDFERSNISGAASARRTLDDLIRFAKETQVDGRPLLANPVVRNRITERWIETEVGRFISYRVASMQDRKLVPNYEASTAKLYHSELSQRIANTGVHVMGLYGQLEPDSPWARLKGRFERTYLTTVASTIAAGTSEIQRNIIATRGLGLPRG
jgi:alkylation response protein AidB-like acyl-CoA dehydrogenase